MVVPWDTMVQSSTGVLIKGAHRVMDDGGGRGLCGWYAVAGPPHQQRWSAACHAVSVSQQCLVEAESTAAGATA